MVRSLQPPHHRYRYPNHAGYIPGGDQRVLTRLISDPERMLEVDPTAPAGFGDRTRARELLKMGVLPNEAISMGMERTRPNTHNTASGDPFLNYLFHANTGGHWNASKGRSMKIVYVRVSAKRQAKKNVDPCPYDCWQRFE